MTEKNIKGNYRWGIVVLLFFATTINYIDRQVIGLLKPELEKVFEWTEKDYSRIVMAFSAAYAIGLVLMGRIVDKIGSKLGYSVSIIFWSIAAIVHAFVQSTGGFIWVRALLGLGESGNFPAAIKVVAEWFPKKERAFATGLFNSGASVGAILAPIFVPLILAAWGWQEAFIVTGTLGFVWLFFWIRYYEIPDRKKKLSKQELDYIHSDEKLGTPEVTEKIPLRKLLGLKATWSFIVGKFFTDPIWWFFLFWLPSYFSSAFNMDLTKPSLQLGVVYGATTLGSIGGGYLSLFLIKRGMALSSARRTSLLIAALLVLPIIAVQFAVNSWQVVGMIALAAAAHNAWSANMFAFASDMLPKSALSSVVGIGGMAGSVGGILFPGIVGILLDHYKDAGNITQGYNILFVICALVYLLAWLIIVLIMRKPRTLRSSQI